MPTVRLPAFNEVSSTAVPSKFSYLSSQKAKLMKGGHKSVLDPQQLLVKTSSQPKPIAAISAPVNRARSVEEVPGCLHGNMVPSLPAILPLSQLLRPPLHLLLSLSLHLRPPPRSGSPSDATLTVKEVALFLTVTQMRCRAGIRI
jgi:hypothetical protein